MVFYNFNPWTFIQGSCNQSALKTFGKFKLINLFTYSVSYVLPDISYISWNHFTGKWKLPCQQGLEYTDCISSAEGLDYPKKQNKKIKKNKVFWVWHQSTSDGEALVLEIWGVLSTPFIFITPRSTLTWCSSTC